MKTASIKPLRTFVFCLVAALLALTGALIFTYDKADAYDEDSAGCWHTVVNATSTPDAGGYLYKTITVHSSGNGFIKGRTLRSTCTIGYADGAFVLAGRNRPDLIYMGPEIPSAGYNAGRGPSSLTTTPNIGGGVTQSTNGNYEVSQDDASAIFINSTRVHCVGMNWNNQFPGCGGLEVYSQGVEAPSAAPDVVGCPSSACPDANAPIRGAGFLDIPPLDITNVVGLDGSGKLNDMSMLFYDRNSWSTSWGSNITLTIRFPNTPPPSGGSFSCPLVPDLTQEVYFVFPGSPGTQYMGQVETPTEYRDYYYVYDSSPSSVSHALSSILSRPGSPYQASIPVGGGDYTHINHVAPYTTDGIDLNYQKFFEQYPYDTHQAIITYSYSVTYNGTLYVRRTDKATGAVIYDGPSAGGGPYATSTSSTQSGTGSNSGPTIGPCFYRTYNASPASPAANLATDPENPTSASFSATINVAFGVDQDPPTGTGQVAQISQVNLPYQIQYYIDRWSGPDGPPTTISGQQMITATSNSINSNGSTTVSTSMAVSVPGTLEAGDRICYTLYTTNANSGSSQTRGRMRLDGSIVDGSGQRQADACTEYVVDRPYFRVYGGDALAGSSFLSSAGACPSNSAASFIGHVRGSGASYSGAGVQLAAFAAAQIDQVTSAIQRTSAPTDPKGLSFANSGVGAPGSTFGGGWGLGNFTCTPSIIASLDPSVPVATGLQVVSGRTLGIGSAPDRTFVDGDAVVTGNIQYTGSSNPAYPNNPRQIPSFVLAVRGDIYITNTVTRIDGILVAEPRADGSGGRIYTCGIYNGITVSRPTEAQIAGGSCDNKLTVNGAILGQAFRPLRAFGSLRDGTEAEGAGGNMAEAIQFLPELWVRSLGLPVMPNTGDYDAIVSLPPVL